MSDVKRLNITPDAARERLRDIAAEIADLEARRADLVAERDGLLQRAVEGASRRAVAADAGLTGGRVQQIVDARQDAGIMWFMFGKTPGPGDDPSGLERASQRIRRRP